MSLVENRVSIRRMFTSFHFLAPSKTPRIKLPWLAQSVEKHSPLPPSSTPRKRTHNTAEVHLNGLMVTLDFFFQSPNFRKIRTTYRRTKNFTHFIHFTLIWKSRSRILSRNLRFFLSRFLKFPEWISNRCGEGGGGGKQESLCREAPPQGPDPYPFMYYFDRKSTPFAYLFSFFVIFYFIALQNTE